VGTPKTLRINLQTFAGPRGQAPSRAGRYCRQSYGLVVRREVGMENGPLGVREALLPWQVGCTCRDAFRERERERENVCVCECKTERERERYRGGWNGRRAWSGIKHRERAESATAEAAVHVWNLVRSNQANVRRWRLLEAGCVRTIPTPLTVALTMPARVSSLASGVQGWRGGWHRSPRRVARGDGGLERQAKGPSVVKRAC